MAKLYVLQQVIVSLFLLFTSLWTFANTDSEVRLLGSGVYPLNASMQVLVDESKILTIDQIRTDEYKGKFKASGSGVMNLGLSSNVYWLKVTLSYPAIHPNTESHKQWLLELDKALLNMAELYTPQIDGEYKVQLSDLRVPFSQREFSHVNSVFPISLELGEVQTLYLRIQSMSSLHFSLMLWSEAEFSTKAAREEFIYGLYFGCMLILLIYNAFLYRSLNDVVYFYYVAYLGGITLFSLLSIGHGFIHYEEYVTFIGKEYVGVVIWVSLWFGTMFFKRFLNTKVEHPRFDAVANVLLSISIVNIVIGLLNRDYISIVWASFASAIYLTFLVLTSLYCWLNGNPVSRLLFFGWVFNAVGLIVYILLANQVVPSNLLTQAAAPTGIVFEAVFLSFALGARIKRERSRLLRYDTKTIDNLLGHESIFKNSLEGRYQMTMAGLIYNANASLAAMFGLSTTNEAIIKNRDFAKKLFENSKDQYYQLMTSGHTENTIEISNGENPALWAHHRALLIRTGEYENDYIEGTITNITDVVLRENAVKYEESERRYKEIASAELEAKNNFMSMINHEIRTPLTSIIGYSEQMKEEGRSGRSDEVCKKMIIDNSRQLLQLVNDILDLSKIEANKLAIESLSVAILDIVREIAERFIPLAFKKNIRFDITLLSPIPKTVIIDPTRVIQILDNLCSNAIKYTEKGSVEVCLSWKDEGLIFDVNDSGIGVPEHLRPTLFDRLGGNVSDNPNRGGAGLGLAISSRLSDLMGGKIYLKEIEGEGSTFGFSIPAVITGKAEWISQGKVDKLTATVRALASSKKKSAPAKQLMGTVLVAEDNTVNQRLISKILRKIGVKVVMVGDGLEACNYCDQQLPDMILMDINMPVRDGLEATKYLRDKHYNTPVYALTAETGKEELKSAMVAGCQGVIGKPIRYKELYRTLFQHLPRA